MPDPSVFKSGRQFAAWLGLVPRQNSSGGKEGLGRVSKMGNGYLRRLPVVGATSVSRRAESDGSRTGPLGEVASGAKARAPGDGSDRQQDRANRMGAADAGRKLQGHGGSVTQRRMRTPAAPAKGCKGRCE